MYFRITTIGGGSGTFQLLSGLKQIQDLYLSAIISVADNGGSTGLIRDKYKILPPGDFRRAVAALAKNTSIIQQLFEYQFSTENGVIGSNKIGNILLTALVDITGDYETALTLMGDIFDVRGSIIPVTLEDVHIGVEFEDGIQVIGEKNIDISDKNPGIRTHNIDQNIVNAWLEGEEGRLNPRAKQAILESDFIIIGPGDLYTSIVPNLLSPGMSEALATTSAKIIYICNIMTKRGETTHMEVPDFVKTIERYISPATLDYIVVNNGYISETIAERYQTFENKKPLKIKNSNFFANKKYKIVEADLLLNEDLAYHDSFKTARILEKIFTNTLYKK